MTIITFSQKTDNDMTVWSEEVEEERDALLEIVSIPFFYFTCVTRRRKRNLDHDHL